MIIRTTTLFAAVLAFTMTSSAQANDIEDFFRMLMNHSTRQSGHRGMGQGGPQFDHDDHDDHDEHFNHGQPFHQTGYQQVQQFQAGPGPTVMPFANPGIPQPRLDINGRYLCGQGLRITRVLCGGLAEQLGLRRGDTIVAINGETIRSRSHFEDLLRDAVVCHGGHVCLLVRSGCGCPELVTVHAHFPTCNHQVQHNHW